MHETTLIGESASIRELRLTLSRLAKSGAPVLLCGETGTGKDVAAKYLHEVSGRPQFVRVDCAAIQDTLIGSDLFGHARGAFTGANSSRTGLVELADGGTLFLDEIGELDLLEQKRLLTVLSTGEIRALGSNQPKQVSFRLVAATNRDLKEEVERGRFRADLYYRINVVRVDIAPLRNRPEDIPLLAAHFLRLSNPELSISDWDLELLKQYPWPGNVRQLQSCVQRLAVFAQNETVSLDDASCTVRQAILSPVPSPTSSNGQTRENPVRIAPTPPETVDAIQRVEHSEPAILRHVLNHCSNNRTLAAVALGIGRSTLYRKMRRYGLN